MISYAQNREDVLLSRVFAGQPTGFYIDVGAGDPVEHSVTKHFSGLGWRGVNVEPVRLMWAALADDRPNDVNLNVAVGARAGQQTFYNVSDRYLSTLDPEVAAQAAALGGVVTEQAVEVVTLAAICEQHAAGRTIDFLKIDVEGWEEQVLAGADFHRFRPRLVVAEATAPNTPHLTHERWEPLLTRHGYRFAHFDGLNRYYLRAEDAELADRFAVPPNVFDDFVPHREVELVRRLQAAEADRERLLAERDEPAGRPAAVNGSGRVPPAAAHQLRRLRAEAGRRAAETRLLAAELAAVKAERDALRPRLAHAEHEAHRLACAQADLYASRFWRHTGWLRRAGKAAVAMKHTVQPPPAASAPAHHQPAAPVHHHPAPAAPPPAPRVPVRRRLLYRLARPLAAMIERRVAAGVGPLAGRADHLHARLDRLEAELVRQKHRADLGELFADVLVRHQVVPADGPRRAA